MGKWIYRKREPPEIRGLCVKCERNPQKKVSRTDKYRPLCSTCDSELRRSKNGKDRDRVRHSNHQKETTRPYRKYVKTFCEKCGFVPEHLCQLDVDHIDGNHLNNGVHNLQTLCANCHRLKTYFQKNKSPSLR